MIDVFRGLGRLALGLLFGPILLMWMILKELGKK